LGIRGKFVVGFDSEKRRLLRNWVVVEEGGLLTKDVERLVGDVRRTAEGIWSRMPENHYLGWSADEASPQSLRPWEG
jgi:hypothetical protein